MEETERERELKREDERERKGRKNRATTFTPELVLPSKNNELANDFMAGCAYRRVNIL